MSGLLNLAGFLISASGAVLGVAGSLIMANAYHPYSLLDFVRTCFYVLALLVSNNGKRAKEHLRRTQFMARLNDEDRTQSLMGLCVIFFGFLLQMLGAILSFAGSK